MILWVGWAQLAALLLSLRGVSLAIAVVGSWGWSILEAHEQDI